MGLKNLRNTQTGFSAFPENCHRIHCPAEDIFFKTRNPFYKKEPGEIHKGRPFPSTIPYQKKYLAQYPT